MRTAAPPAARAANSPGNSSANENFQATHPQAPNGSAPARSARRRPSAGGAEPELVVDLERRRDQLIARVAELQWDLGGLVYEMAIRDQIKVEVLVKRAVVLQDADAELSEVERSCGWRRPARPAPAACGAPHSSGAAFCWQCGQPLLAQVSATRSCAADRPLADAAAPAAQPKRPLT